MSASAKYIFSATLIASWKLPKSPGPVGSRMPMASTPITATAWPKLSGSPQP